MNLYEQLIVIRGLLEEIGAHDDSMDLVEELIVKSEPVKHDRSNISQQQVLRRMTNMPKTISNFNIYNDLQILLGDPETTSLATREEAAPAAYIAEKAPPKPKSYYRAKKEKEKKDKS